MKTIKNREHRISSLTQLLTVILVIGCLAGCADRQSDNSQDQKQAGSDLPKLTLHRPKDFTTAITRLVEISDLIQSKDPLPAPKLFKVLEVVHGTGSSAHSHYYLADSEERDDHGHETSAEKTHDLEIDLFTELDDIVRWLPGIAGDGDMDKATWDQVNKISESLDSALDKVSDGKSGTELRNAIAAEKSISEYIDQLSTLSKATMKNTEQP